ncbi:MAG: HD domain-containing protein [Lachnospiraceae bacterium]|nr:HD domain-containing protein [Lachnospiraceae bacterium]
MTKTLKRSICIALAIILTCAVPVYADTDPAQSAGNEEGKLSVDFTAGSSGYSEVLYDNSNGLPTSEANAITQTSDGFIWIGSYSGLIRYDGNTFDRIDSTTGIASVVSLYADSKDRLWIGTNDSGVFLMEKGNLSKYNKDNGLKSLSVRSVTEDPDGCIYIATTHGIAYIDEELVMHPLDETQINDKFIMKIFTGRDGVIYGITKDGAIFTIEGEKLTGYYDGAKLGIEDAYSIYPDPQKVGRIYIGTKGSKIYRGMLDNGMLLPESIDVAPLTYINAMQLFDNQLWVSADNGVGFIENGKFTLIEGLPFNSSIEGAIRDYQGNLWFASSKQGVMKIVPNQFTDIFDKYDLPVSVVNSTCLFDGKLFIGCKNTGLMVVDSNGRVDELPVASMKDTSGEDLGSTDLIKLLTNVNIRSIVRDSKGRIWISTYGDTALLRYDGKDLLRFSEAGGLPSDRVRTIVEKKDGNYMIACTGGLVITDGDKVTNVYDKSSGINDTEILTVAEDDRGTMVIGTDGDGIYVLKDNKAIHVGIESGLASEVVMRLKYDSKRDLFWIVTSNSIAYMDSDDKVTTIAKFPYSNNFDMYENSEGKMWILSSNGIYVVPTDELVANGDISPVFYGADNGLPCIATANSYSELTSSGDLYISGTTGVARVNIEESAEDVGSIKMTVPYVEGDGKRYYADDSGTITLPSKVNKLTVYAYVFTYSLINPQVSYSLKGLSDNVTTVRRSELAPVDYTNLSGGDYYFTMQLRDDHGKGSNEMSIHIVKEKAFHETIWFYVLMILLAVAVIALIVRAYIRTKTLVYERKAAENKKLVREIVTAFAKTIDMKDKYTNGHSARVADYTAMLTRELGYDEETVEKYYNIALMHDIGKIGVPEEVLNKQGKLTDEEFHIIKSHTSLGYDALKNISVMPELATGAGSHHERPDGKGYPTGAKGDDIPRVAQIIGVADCFDAMYSDRPYRKRMNFDKAVSIITEVAGTQLTQDVVDAFLRLVAKGEFRAPDDVGGGTTEDITNIHDK